MAVQLNMNGLYAPSATMADDLATKADVTAADPAAVARFESLVNGVGNEAKPLAAPDAAIGRINLGESILAGLQGLSGGLQESWQAVSDVFGKPMSAITSTDLLKAQFGLATATMQYELVGKVVSRTTQDIDQLVKLQ